jgi:hypothetical protein
MAKGVWYDFGDYYEVPPPGDSDIIWCERLLYVPRYVDGRLAGVDAMCKDEFVRRRREQEREILFRDFREVL